MFYNTNEAHPDIPSVTAEPHLGARATDDHTAEPYSIGQEPGGDRSGNRFSTVPLQSHIALGWELGWELSPVGGRKEGPEGRRRGRSGQPRQKQEPHLGWRGGGEGGEVRSEGSGEPQQKQEPHLGCGEKIKDPKRHPTQTTKKL